MSLLSIFNRNSGKVNTGAPKQQPMSKAPGVPSRSPQTGGARPVSNGQMTKTPQSQNQKNAVPNRRVAPPAPVQNSQGTQNRQGQGANAVSRVPRRTPPPRPGAPLPTASTGRGTVYPQIPQSAQQTNRPTSVKPAAPVQKQPPAARVPAAPAQKVQPSPAGVKKQPAPTPKKPRGPIITAEGVRAFFFVLLVSFVLYALVCVVSFGVFYAIHNVRFDWNHEITVKLDKGVPRTEKYVTNEKVVFRDPSGEAYVNLTKIADSLSLSSIGGGNQIKFYKTNDLDSYIVFTSGSKETVINGEQIRLSSPVYISQNSVYVPIGLFCYYTSGISVSYDAGERIMTITYEIDEELSTPKRKVLKDFEFIVHAPQSIPEMTEKEWFEYVENIKT